MKRIDLRVKDGLYKAIKETAASEETSVNALIANLLEDVFIGPNLVQVPILGHILADGLGTVVWNRDVCPSCLNTRKVKIADGEEMTCPKCAAGRVSDE